MSEITIENLFVSFTRRHANAFAALQDVSAHIKPQTFVALVGLSGSGKTTLLNVVAGLQQPTRGRVLLNGRPITGPGSDRGVVFQQDALFMWRSVVKNVEYGLEVKGLPRGERRALAEHWLTVVGLIDFAHFFPKELSGGMKKRCQLAMVLANEPSTLLMDEPYGALDYVTKCQLQDELLALLNTTPKTTLFVTHDIEEALYLSDRVLVLSRGRLIADMPVAFDSPRTNDLRLSPEFAIAKQRLWRSLDGATEQPALSLTGFREPIPGEP